MFKASRHKHKTLAMIRAFIAHAKVVSITQRLKRAKPQLEKLITLGKRASEIGEVRVLRLVRSKLKCKQATACALVLLASAFKHKAGGYIKLLKLGGRLGDGAHLSVMLPSF